MQVPAERSVGCSNSGHGQHRGLLEKQRMLGWGQCPGQEGCVLGHASRLGSAQSCPCSQPASGQMPGIRFFITFPIFQLFQMWDIFETKLHRGENPTFSTACGSWLSIKGLVPQSTHQPPAKSMVVWSWTQSDWYPSICQPLPQKMSLKHLNTGVSCPSSHFRVKTLLSFHKLL